MASIQEVKDGFKVRYDIYEKGIRRQIRTDKFNTRKEAQAFLDCLEQKIKNGKKIIQSNKMFKEVAEDFITIYESNNWSGGTYDAAVGLIHNHLYPEFGNIMVRKITALEFDLAMQRIQQKKSGSQKYASWPEEEKPPIAYSTFRWIYILANQIFDHAVKWEYIDESPIKSDLPKNDSDEDFAEELDGDTEKFWVKEELDVALKNITDPVLHLSVHVAVICTMRIGEVCGLSWECIDFDNRRLKINRTLQRLSVQTIEKTRTKIIKIFPAKTAEKSRLVLKAVKTKKGYRGQAIPLPLLAELYKMKERQEMEKKLKRDYNDYGLIFTLDNGDPVEPNRMLKWFKTWWENIGDFYGLPYITFHGLRHTSVTYKTGLTTDLKAVQAQSGHASVRTLEMYMHKNNPSSLALTENVSNDFYSQKEIEASLKIINEVKESLETERKKKISIQDQIEESLVGTNQEGEAMANILLALKKKDPLLHRKVLLAVLAE